MFDLSAGNAGTDSTCDRQNDADLEPTTDNDGVCIVSLTAPGEWVSFGMYSVNGGEFDITLRVASGLSPSGEAATIAVRINEQTIVDSIEVRNLIWSQFQNIKIPNVSIADGNQTMKVSLTTDFVNLNYIDFE